MMKKFLAALSAAVMIITAVPSAPVSASGTQSDEEYSVALFPVNDVGDVEYKRTSDEEETSEVEEFLLGNAYIRQQFTLATVGTEASAFIRSTSSYISNEAFDVFPHPDGARLFYREMLEWAEDFFYGRQDGYYTTFNYSDGTSESCYVTAFNFSAYEITLDEAQAAYVMLRNSCPMTYFFDRSVTYGSVTLYPHIFTDYVSKSSRTNIRSMIDTYIDSYSDAATQKSLYHKAKYIHDKEAAELSYAFKSDGSTAEDAEWAHCIIGPMTKKKGVCEAYSRTFQMLFNYYGGEAMYVHGDAAGRNAVTGATFWGAHAWNVVKLDDSKYYLLDVTFDDPVIIGTGVDGNVRYDYFAKGSAAMASTHRVSATEDLTKAKDVMNYQFSLPEISSTDFSLVWLNSFLQHTHSYSRTVTKASTCTQHGIMTYTCTICGDTYTEELPLTSHDYYEVKTVPSTCKRQGYTLYSCTICGEEYKDNYQPLAPHTYTSELTVQPDCTENGERTYTCTECGSQKTETVLALGHDFKSYRTVPSTCKEQGYTVYKCSRCGEEENRDPMPLASHNFTSEITKPSTCLETGVRTYTCTVCGETRTEEIPLAEHKYQLVQVVPPTCTEGGYSVYVCSVCSDSCERDLTDPKGHSLVYVPEQPAACEESGTKAYWRCSECDLMFADREGRSIIGEPETIPAKGHDYRFTERVEPTYDAEGYELYVCANDPTHTVKTVLDCKERDLGDAVVTLKGENYIYTGREIAPAGDVTVEFENEQLALGVDYELEFSDNVDYGDHTAKITVKGIGKYVGSRTVSFSIVPMTSAITDIEVRDEGVCLSWTHDRGTDGYEVQYSRSGKFAEADTFGRILSDCDSYTIEVMPTAGETWYFRIRPFAADSDGSGSKCFGSWSGIRSVKIKGLIGRIEVLSECEYDGSEQRPKVTVTSVSGKELINGVDYRLSYKNNTEVGVAEVTAVGIGGYTGSAVEKFVIAPGNDAVVTAIPVGRGVIAAAALNVDSNAFGVEYCIAEDPELENVVMYASSKGTFARMVCIAGLDSGKTYYVAARPYITVGNTVTAAGVYSKPAEVRT